VADRLDNLQRHGLCREQSERPVGEARRRWPQPPGHALGFLHPVEHLATHASLRFARQRGLKACRHETLAKVFDGLRTTVERAGDLRIGPVRAIRLRLKQHGGTQHLLRRNPSLLDQIVQHFSLSLREPNNIFLWQGPTLLGWAYMAHNCLRTLPQFRSLTEH
jgi:hypothetical protein